MKKIFGYVLVKETNSGFPNLVVIAYDSENPSRKSSREQKVKKRFRSKTLESESARFLQINKGDLY
jgi:hypothetical protein